MRLHIVLRYVGLVLLLNAAFLLASAFVSFLYGGEALFPLFFSGVVTALFGLFPLVFVPQSQDLSRTEGLIVVVGSWLLCCLVGAFPYILWGGDFTLTNAVFESVSGFTTTGASIVRDIEALPKGLLFWRAATNWIGGVGIIVFVVAILPWLGGGGLVLYQAELPERTRQGLRFRARRAVQMQLAVYVGLTVLETAALLLCGMNLFDAATHSFATIATGGFSPRNASIAAYDSVAVESVVMVFMILSGMHFALLLAAALGNVKALFRSAVTRYYLAAMLVGTIAVSVNIHGHAYPEWGESFRHGAFQVVSLGTSTGFASADSSIWPPLAQMLIIFFTLQCACAGSTSGGIKADRVVILGKSFRRELWKRLFPSAIITLRQDRETLNEDLVSLSVLYIAIYVLVVFLAAALLAALGIDALTAFSGTAAAMGNVGPGLGTVGSTGNYFHIADAGKWILAFIMILGRLEIYGLIVFFMPRAWKGL